jgi:uncharacterized protein YbjT (DUF2867 family)
VNVLVVGANGQLGAACCRALVAEGHEVRGSVRALGRATGLGLDGVGLVEADLAADPHLDALLAGVQAVVLTANAVAPRAGDDPTAFEAGVERLVAAAGRLGVERIVLPSFPVTPVDAGVPLAAERRGLERMVLAAVPGSVILRLPPFMEAWLALVGSEIPLRGEPNATIGRPSPFLGRFRRLTGSLVEERGLMLVPGPTTRRQAFIAIRDAAAACAAAVTRTDLAGRTIDVAGPEVLSWQEVAGIYSRVLGRRVRAISTPTGVFAVASALLGPVAAVPSRTMALNRFVGSSESAWDEAGGGLVDPAAMTTVEQFLTEKRDLPAALPTVA